MREKMTVRREGICAFARKIKVDRTHLQKVLSGRRKAGRRTREALAKEGVAV
jgi:hypothetical protein